MSTLEREIMEKFHQLQPPAKLRVRALIEQEVATEFNQANEPEFNHAAWARDVEALRQQIRASQGDKQPPLDVVGMLRDIRDGEDE
ncbi:MAG: hypothetical protein ACYDBJ_28985 [Aggregatilineales bacterium]